MDRQKLTQKQKKQLRFAEAGLLFVLILSATIFVGVKIVSHNVTDEAVEALVVTGDTAEGSAATSQTTTASANPGQPETADQAPATTVATDGEAVVESVEPQTTAVTPSPVEPVTYAMAEAAYFAGDYVEAVTLFEHYSEEHPENAWGFYMLGLSLRKDDNLEAAEDAFAAALELKPEHSKSLVNLARVLLELDRAGEALPLVEQVVQNEVHNVAALRVLGRVHDNLDHRAEAIAAYEAALRVDRDDAWSLNNLGLLYIEAERFDQALAPLARACQIDDQVACFQNNLGVALERSGHAGAAQAAFSAAVTADPGYAKAIASRDRLAAVDGTDQLDEVDLVALADGFQVEPVLAADETTAAAAEGSEEIAALVPANATSASAELEEKR